MLKFQDAAKRRLMDARKKLAGFAADESGAAMVEYALLIGLIAVAGAAVLGGVGTGVANRFTAITTRLNGQ